MDVPLDDRARCLIPQLDDIKDPDFPLIWGIRIPEFGTEFAMNMLKDTKPTTVADCCASADFPMVRMYGWATRQI
ncbi:MAG: hypothetical protein ACLUVV_02240 [Christensenellales bacterium]